MRPRRCHRLFVAALVLGTALGALGACEAGPELFVACAADGSCEGALQCYTKEGIVGYCTTTCYGSIECPAESVCYEGKCLLICTSEDDCPGGTICNLVEPPRGICQP